MKFHALAGLSGLALVLGACAGSTPSDRPDDFGYDGKTGIQFNISPLTLNGTTDGCYSFAVVNGLSQYVVGRGPSAIVGNLPGATGVPATNTPADGICGSRFGQGAEVSYVAPCDASEAARDHKVHLWVEDLCTTGTVAGGDCVSNTTFQNPCPTQNGCYLDVQCTENADTPVTFNFTIMDSAQQGFFDIAVNFDNIFCSAKLDTCYDVGTDNQTPINLLFNSTGTRIPTSVLALACTTGEGAVNNTFLHLGNVTVTCGTETTTLDLSTVTQEGNQTAVDGLSWAAYFGSESLETAAGASWNKEYFNVAVAGFGPGCSVSWAATATDGAALAGGGAGIYNSYPVINYGPTTVTAANGDWLCSQNPVNEPGSGVETTYEPCSTPGDCLGGPCVTEQAGVFTDCEAGEPPVQLGCPDGQGITVVTNLNFAGDLQQPATFTVYIPPLGVSGGQPAYSVSLTEPNGTATVSATYSVANGWTLISDPPGPAVLTVTHPTLVGTWADYNIVSSIPSIEVVGISVSCVQSTDYICVEWAGRNKDTPFSGSATLYETSYGPPASVSGWGQNGLNAVNVLTNGVAPWIIQLPGTPSAIQVPTGVDTGGNPVPGAYALAGDISADVVLSEGPCPEAVELEPPFIYSSYVDGTLWSIDIARPVPPSPGVAIDTLTPPPPGTLQRAYDGQAIRMDMIHDQTGNHLIVHNGAVDADGQLRVSVFSGVDEIAATNVTEFATTGAWLGAGNANLENPGNLYIANGFATVGGEMVLLAAQMGAAHDPQRTVVEGMNFFKLTLAAGNTVEVTYLGTVVPEGGSGAYTTAVTAWALQRPDEYRNFWLKPDGVAVLTGPGIYETQSPDKFFVNAFAVDFANDTLEVVPTNDGGSELPGPTSIHGFFSDGAHFAYTRGSGSLLAPGTVAYGVRDLSGTVVLDVDTGAPLDVRYQYNFGSFNPQTGLWIALFQNTSAYFYHMLGTDPASLNLVFEPTNQFFGPRKYQAIAAPH